MTAKTFSARAFEAGRVAGMAHGNWLAESVHAVGEILPADMTPAQYRTIRAAWCKGYAEAMGCKPVTAENQWSKVWKGVEQAYGFKKPQSEEARRKAAQRAARRSTAAGDGEPAAPETPAKGSEAAQKVKLELSRIEAHIVSLIRRKQFGAAINCLHKMAEEADPTA